MELSLYVYVSMCENNDDDDDYNVFLCLFLCRPSVLHIHALLPARA